MTEQANNQHAHHAVDQATATAEDRSADAYGASAGGVSEETQARYDTRAAEAWCVVAEEHAGATRLAYEEDDEARAFHHAAQAYQAASNATHHAEHSEHNEAGNAAASDARNNAHQAGANSEGAW